MKAIKTSGLIIFLLGLAFFTSLLFVGEYKVSQQTFETIIKNKNIKSEWFKSGIQTKVVDKEYYSSFALSKEITSIIETSKEIYRNKKEWDYVIGDQPHNVSYEFLKNSGKGFVLENKGLLFFLTFGLGIIGALLFILPNVILLGKPGIKNDGIYHSSATNRGWIGILTGFYLVGFYLLLYFYPDFVVNWTYILDPISKSLS